MKVEIDRNTRIDKFKETKVNFNRFIIFFNSVKDYIATKKDLKQLSKR